MSPPRRLDDLAQADLAVLVREYLLCGHLMDRASMGYLIGPYGVGGMRDIAIDEWMGASPIYTARMAELLGFAGDDVPTIFKGMQFDVGAPPEFLDFRYTVHDASHGEFRLDHCGALMDVEPMGEEFVVAMCHDIEDPTFDATACATNPRARVRPVHRPPRVPADRDPHCAWTVVIDPHAEPIAEASSTTRMRSTVAAALPLPTIVGVPGEAGRLDYSGAVVDRIQMEAFAKSALLAIAEEVCLQQHLLAMSFMAAVESRHGPEAALEMGDRQLTGTAGLTAERLAAALGVSPGLDGIAQVMELHPLLRPRSYLDARVLVEPSGLSVAVLESPAFAESGTPGWVHLLESRHDRAMSAIARAVDPRARCERIGAANDARMSWQVHICGDRQPEQPEVAVAKLSTGASFAFEAPSEVRVELR